jgi:copper chaperone
VTVQHLSTYRVEGMSSSQAVRAISQQLSAVPGVRDIHIAITRGEVTVLSDRPLPQEAIAAAIDLAGYALAAPHPDGLRQG